MNSLEVRSLEHLNCEIRRCLLNYAAAAGPRRSAFFRQLVWAESMRERLHDVPAPKRRRL
jgi:hypothetical protein